MKRKFNRQSALSKRTLSKRTFIKKNAAFYVPDHKFLKIKIAFSIKIISNFM